MKRIEAIIRPHPPGSAQKRSPPVKVSTMIISEVQSYGRQRRHTETYRGAEYQIEFIPRIKVEVIVPDEIEDAAIRAIINTALTRKFGDGKIFVVPWTMCDSRSH